MDADTQPADAPATETELDAAGLPDLEAMLDAEAPEDGDEPEDQTVEPEPPQAQAEPPSPPPAPPSSEDPRLAEGLAAIMRESRELQEMRRQLEADRAKLEPLRRYEELHRRLEEQDAEGVLQELNLDLNELNRAVIEGRGVKPHGRLQRQIEDKLAEMERQTQERLARIEALEAERVRAEAMAELRQNVSAERHPLTAAIGDLGLQAVVEKAQQHYSRDGRAPTYDQVISEVEAELVSFVDRLMANETVRQRYLGSAQQTKAPSPTLTNPAAAQVSKRRQQPTNQDLPEDREDAIEWLLSQET